MPIERDAILRAFIEAGLEPVRAPWFDVNQRCGGPFAALALAVGKPTGMEILADQADDGSTGGGHRRSFESPLAAN